MVKVSLIEPHEMVCNLLIPKTLIVAPRQSGKTTAIRKAIESIEYYKVFVASKNIKDIAYIGIKNVHLSKDFNQIDVDSIAYKIFVDDIDCMEKDKKYDNYYVSLETPGIYAATTSILDFDRVQQLIRRRRFDFER